MVSHHCDYVDDRVVTVLIDISFYKSNTDTFYHHLSAHVTVCDLLVQLKCYRISHKLNIGKYFHHPEYVLSRIFVHKLLIYSSTLKRRLFSKHTIVQTDLLAKRIIYFLLCTPHRLHYVPLCDS